MASEPRVADIAGSWVELLRQVPFLSAISDKLLLERLVLGKIPQVETPAAMVQVPDGEYVIREGDFGDTFYLVLAGELVVEVWSDSGLSVEVTRIGRGAYFGELAMIGRGMRAASVRAHGEGCAVLEIYKGPFERLMKDDASGQLRKALEAIYSRRTIERFIREHDMLRALTDEDKALVTKTGLLRRVEAYADVYKAGDAPRGFFFIRQGFLKVWRIEGDTESVLAYLRDRDFFGDLELIAGRPRICTVTAMEPAEILELPRSTFATIYQRYPQLLERFRKYEIEHRVAEPKLNSQTGVMFVKDLIESGMGQARSALIINMDLCTRCGNCVQACSDLHDGYSRLIRRGKKLTHRDERDELENLFFPNSCVQCRTPDCMTGCPVGSIARDKDGEVYIKDFCVGCGACAKGCEFGNISMVVIGDKKAAKPKRKASKCDICKGYSDANCVYNCPQAAIIRVDPNTYFDELATADVDIVAMAGRVGR